MNREEQIKQNTIEVQKMREMENMLMQRFQDGGHTTVVTHQKHTKDGTYCLVVGKRENGRYDLIFINRCDVFILLRDSILSLICYFIINSDFKTYQFNTGE